MPDSSASKQRVGIREFRGNLTGFLQQVGEGASFLITSHGRVLAEVRPAPEPVADPAPARRQPGRLRGKIWMAPDFDEWPPGLLDIMEGKDDPDEIEVATKGEP